MLKRYIVMDMSLSSSKPVAVKASSYEEAFQKVFDKKRLIISWRSRPMFIQPACLYTRWEGKYLPAWDFPVADKTKVKGRRSFLGKESSIYIAEIGWDKKPWVNYKAKPEPSSIHRRRCANQNRR